ncbi:hypothetical protein HHK36_006069 [Tetracentron sinense]|uniref:Uncharacterized protein n=1 Tax=Tetracentron sinense TaxID=13715 RepID=A0A835DKI7_TETSI|nr:hypothetical protein HHK36_006069 [Tetracentron sinense]
MHIFTMHIFTTDAVDYKGLPADKTRTGGWVSAGLILGVEVAERLTLMGIGVNLVTYLTATMHLPSATSANIVSEMGGTAFLLCLFGGFLADSFLGRYRTIAIFAAIQVLGTGLLAVSTRLPQLRPHHCNNTVTYKCEQPNGLQMGVLYIALYLTALGTGGIKSSVSGLGADQFDEKDEKEKAQMVFFFNSCLDKAAIIAEGDYKVNGSSTPNPWILCSVTKVEEVKMMVKLLPIWATTIMFWTVHSQMLTFSVEQASTMERSIGKFQIPAGSLTVFFTGAILITLAINDRLIMPLWKKFKGNQGFTNLQRIGIGLMFSIVGMAAAALSEGKRLSVARAINDTASTLPITAFLLIPQFFLVGTGEAFVYTGQLAFFITQSPKGMKAISTGLFLTTVALGFFVSSFLVSVVKKVTESKDGHSWLANDINHGRLDRFYGLLSVLSSINLGFYLLCAAWYKPHTFDNAIEMESDINVSSAEERCE